MAELDLLVRTADRARKAEVTVDSSQTGAENSQPTITNWALPRDVDYTIVNVSKNPPVTLDLSSSLAKAGVGPGDTLEIQPVLVAGGR